MTEVRCPSGRNFSVFSTLLRGSHRLSHPRFLQYDTFGTQIDKFCQSPLVSIFTFHAAVRCRNSHSENARPGFFLRLLSLALFRRPGSLWCASAILIRARLQRLRKNLGLVSGHRVSAMPQVLRNQTPLGVCVRTGFWAIRWNEELENAAPEGRTSLAQRFKRWEKWEE